MAYGENKGRFRETRVGRFVPNMGGEAAPVKSPGIDGGSEASDELSEKLQNTSYGCTGNGCATAYYADFA
jgi:hypothetical protein